MSTYSSCRFPSFSRSFENGVYPYEVRESMPTACRIAHQTHASPLVPHHRSVTHLSARGIPWRMGEHTTSRPNQPLRVILLVERSNPLSYRSSVFSVNGTLMMIGLHVCTRMAISIASIVLSIPVRLDTRWRIDRHIIY